jgi:hypothetical protein
MINELGQDLLELMAMEHKHPVEAFALGSPHEPLGECVRPRIG